MNLPKSKRRQIRDIVLARLTADGTPLKRFVRTWQLHQGHRGETDEWTVAMLPALRVGWNSGPQAWRAENQHSASLAMEITIGLAGSNQGDLMDFWDAVEQVLFPCSDPHGLFKSIQDLGATSAAIEQAAISDKGFAPGVLGQSATGIIRIRHNIQTA